MAENWKVQTKIATANGGTSKCYQYPPYVWVTFKLRVMGIVRVCVITDLFCRATRVTYQGSQLNCARTEMHVPLERTPFISFVSLRFCQIMISYWGFRLLAKSLLCFFVSEYCAFYQHTVASNVVYTQYRIFDKCHLPRRPNNLIDVW